jgi:hypothetical protein
MMTMMMTMKINPYKFNSNAALGARPDGHPTFGRASDSDWDKARSA